jgi:hypothetical protein
MLVPALDIEKVDLAVCTGATIEDDPFPIG